MLWLPHGIPSMSPFWAPSVGLNVGYVTLEGLQRHTRG